MNRIATVRCPEIMIDSDSRIDLVSLPMKPIHPSSFPLASLIASLRADGCEDPIAMIDCAQRIADMIADVESDGMEPPHDLLAWADAIAENQPAIWAYVKAGYIGGGASLKEIASGCAL